MKGIEIPFGAKDSELKGWEYTIPEGMEAEIKDGKIVVREKKPELTPLAQALSDYLINDFDFFATKKWDKKKWNEVMNTQAAELLAIAKKEICRGCTVGLEQYCKGREDAKEEAEMSYTFQYPVYPAMCFRGGVCTNPMRDCINCPMHSSGATTNTITSGTCKKD